MKLAPVRPDLGVYKKLYFYSFSGHVNVAPRTSDLGVYKKSYFFSFSALFPLFAEI